MLLKDPRCRELIFSSCIITMSAPKGPFRLVTVNTAPERAKRLIGRVVEALSDRYTIIHVANCESEYSMTTDRELPSEYDMQRLKKLSRR